MHAHHNVMQCAHNNPCSYLLPTGWAEALGQEYETLQYQVQMSREELRLLRHHIKRRQREILYLQIELEEVEMDMDNMEVAMLLYFLCFVY